MYIILCIYKSLFHVFWNSVIRWINIFIESSHLPHTKKKKKENRQIHGHRKSDCQGLWKEGDGEWLLMVMRLLWGMKKMFCIKTAVMIAWLGECAENHWHALDFETTGFVFIWKSKFYGMWIIPQSKGNQWFSFFNSNTGYKVTMGYNFKALKENN